MGTNAVGLNSSIPLDVKTPPPTDLAAEYGKLLALKNAGIEGQVRSAQVVNEQLQNRQLQHAIDAKNALDLAYKNNWKQDPTTGKWDLDQEGYHKDLTAAGYGPEGVASDKARYDALDSQVKYKANQADLMAKRGQALADLEAPVPRPNMDEPDDQKRGAQVQAFQASATVATNTALKRQLISPDEYNYAMGLISNPTKQTVAQFDAYAKGGQKAADTYKDVQDQINDAHRNHLSDVQAGEGQAKTEQTVRSNVASALSAAKDLPTYTRAYDTLASDPANKKALALVPKPEDIADGDALKAAIPNIQKLGQTAQEQVQTGLTASGQTIAQQRADANDKKTDALIAATLAKGQAKPAQFTSVSKTKEAALQKSQDQLDKDLKAATVGGFVDPDAHQQAYRDYQSRNDAAQSAYEEQVGDLTGHDIRHNSWAKDQPIPPAPTPNGKTGTPAAAPTVAPVAAQPKTPVTASKAAPILPGAARARLKEGVDTTFGNGQIWTLRNGKPTMVSAGGQQ